MKNAVQADNIWVSLEFEQNFLFSLDTFCLIKFHYMCFFEDLDSTDF